VEAVMSQHVKPDFAKFLAPASEICNALAAIGGKPVATGAAAAEQTIRAGRVKAGAEALRYLAELQCPPDVVEFGRNHKIPLFAEVTWQGGFVAGWRLATAYFERQRKES
jgi:hypothetical protein